MQPITFRPIYKERIWGGRQLEERYGRSLPAPEIPYGEAWEIVDREDAQSVVDGGGFSGKSLHELWTDRREEIFGEGLPDSPRFPILIKILDCADDLSIQVHPPADIAPELGGEPKTEMWYIADCKPGAKLYVGLKDGADRASFEKAISEGTVADQVHAILPEKGRSIFIESGRLHAIGAGFLIHEIQQNSDTTYRVFDWNRTDAQGNPRDLHVAESLACIDFTDHEPGMDEPVGKTLATCPFFKTTLHHLDAGDTIGNESPVRFSLITVIEGALAGGFITGQTLLLPRSAASLVAERDTKVLRIVIP
ncbi:class I mannose-6-phosphate isomerase [Akkermansiaceae bacterium]|nr:class I mannose-6-phosphate isomerase [Akkermansiaceae bacterium]